MLEPNTALVITLVGWWYYQTSSKPGIELKPDIVLLVTRCSIITELILSITG